jgi:hypothetical protein
MSEPIEVWQLYTDDPFELMNLLCKLPHLEDAAIRRYVIHHEVTLILARSPN